MDSPWLAICGDEETGEKYLARVLDESARGHAPPIRPIVEILQVWRYPNQRAIAHPDILLDLPPLDEKTICRMAAIRPATPEEITRFSTYRESWEAAWNAAFDQAASDGERAILLRHKAGIFLRKRRILAYRPWEWQQIRCPARAEE